MKHEKEQYGLFVLYPTSEDTEIDMEYVRSQRSVLCQLP